MKLQNPFALFATLVMILCCVFPRVAKAAGATSGIVSISMDGFSVATDGGTFPLRVSAGVQKTFRVAVTDPAALAESEDSDKVYTLVRFWEEGRVVSSRYVKGDPADQSLTYEFQAEGLAQVSAKVRTKDMTEQAFDAVPEFMANVKIAERPKILLQPYFGRNIFRETDTGNVYGRIDVRLSEPPSGLDLREPITVVLEITRNGLNDGPMPVLSRYEIPFLNGQVFGFFYFTELKGTPQSARKGFRIRAYIKETTVCPKDPSRTWRQYYAPVDDFDVFIEYDYPPGLVILFS